MAWDRIFDLEPENTGLPELCGWLRDIRPKVTSQSLFITNVALSERTATLSPSTGLPVGLMSASLTPLYC